MATATKAPLIALQATSSASVSGLHLRPWAASRCYADSEAEPALPLKSRVAHDLRSLEVTLLVAIRLLQPTAAGVEQASPAVLGRPKRRWL